MVFHCKIKFYRVCLSLLLLLSYTTVSAQKVTKVELVQADSLEYDRNISEDIRRAIGNVIFKHDETYLYCDSAYFYKKNNSIDAFSNVWINVSDTLNIYGDLLEYDGNVKNAELHGNVKMVDNQMTLTTEHMTYNLKSKIASYYDGGRIVDQENVLESRRGYYYADIKKFFFREQVVLTNPKYVMHSDTLLYHTVSKVAYFFGPTTITSKENIIYCENGWYDTQNDRSQFKKNACIQTEEQKIKGDSLWYDRNIGIGKAFRNVSIIDTIENIIIKGHFAEYYEKDGWSRVTDSALAIMIEKSDSLFLHGDTLKMILDTAQEAKTLYAWPRVRFFRRDLQGICDSLVYEFPDSTIILNGEPALWSDENQITAKRIELLLSNNQVYMMKLLNMAFVAMKDTSGFNQVKGKKMTGYFVDGKLYKLDVVGNSQTIYYVREDDGAMIGLNKAEGSEMLIYFDDNKIKQITFEQQPGGTLFPYKELLPKDMLLKGFTWYEQRRPLDKNDLFKWR